MNRVTVPEKPGSYRWYYVDVTHGEHTVVAIFMIGSLFSSRYAAAPTALPCRHAAVNFAVYERGVRRVWVLSEYGALEASERALTIGGSTLRYLGDRRLELDVRERTVLLGRELEAHITLDALGPSSPPVVLVPGLGHRWHPIAPLATARVEVPSLQLAFEGHGYHDGNDGDVPLGTDLPGWDWERRCSPGRTVVTYRPHGAPHHHAVEVSCSGVDVRSSPAVDVERARTAWGLPVPSAPSARLLESSPFYARLESHGPEGHVLGEVANFERFRSPWIRWMARLRTRMERAA